MRWQSPLLATQGECPLGEWRSVTARAIQVAERADSRDRMRDVSIAAAIVADMASYLRARGVDAGAVCLRAGIDPATTDSGSERIPGRLMAALWREAELATGDPDLGLHMSTTFNPGALDIVGYVMLSSRTADEALRRGARLMRLLNDGLDLAIERDRTTTHCRLIILPAAHELMRTVPRHVVDSVAAGLIHQLRLLTQRPVVPVRVALGYARPSTGTADLARLLGVAPSFGASDSIVTFSNEDLDRPLTSANASLLASFEAVAEAALGALAARETLSGRVDAEIIGRLKGGVPTIVDVSRALAMSARNLQRGLAAEGTTFQAQLDAARRELAMRHLTAPGATVAQVAWLVGFSEPSAFHRAFRRWTGRSPRALTA